MVYIFESQADADLPQAISVPPTVAAERLYAAYHTHPTFSRTVNQIVEQSLGDATVKPIVRNPMVQAVLDGWWEANRWGGKLSRAFKQYLISGEYWCYVPVGERGVKARLLTPWHIHLVSGVEPEEWEEANYVPPEGKTLRLTPENTVYQAHDALFGSLRGTSPFIALYSALVRYETWLKGRERINRLAGKVVGSLRFRTPEEAAASLGWPLDETTGLPRPQPVQLPADGSVVVTFGEDSGFSLITPSVGGGDAHYDGEALRRQLVEATRLPEYLTGMGDNVSVATAKVQFPFAVRMIASLRDEFEQALTATMRKVLAGLAKAKQISRRWSVDGGEETPENCVISWSWPEIQWLEQESPVEVLLSLYNLGLVDGDALLRALGYDPAAVRPQGEPPAPQEALQRVLRRVLPEVLDDWLERQAGSSA